jgi:rubredoxin
MPENQEKELRAIRGLLEQAQERIGHMLVPAEALHMRWRCTACGYIKHFTRPMPARVAPPCPNATLRRFRQLTNNRSVTDLFSETTSMTWDTSGKALPYEGEICRQNEKPAKRANELPARRVNEPRLSRTKATVVMCGETRKASSKKK